MRSRSRPGISAVFQRLFYGLDSYCSCQVARALLTALGFYDVQPCSLFWKVRSSESKKGMNRSRRRAGRATHSEDQLSCFCSFFIICVFGRLTIRIRQLRRTIHYTVFSPQLCGNPAASINNMRRLPTLTAPPVGTDMPMDRYRWDAGVQC